MGHKIERIENLIRTIYQKDSNSEMATRGRKRKIDEATSEAEDNSIEEPQLKKVKFEDEETKEQMEIEPAEQFEQISLPPEIMISIFERLSREDLARASMTCQEWLSYSRDPLFGWVECGKHRFYSWEVRAADVPLQAIKIEMEELGVEKVSKGGHMTYRRQYVPATEHDEYTYKLTLTAPDGRVWTHPQKIKSLDTPLATSKDDSNIIRMSWYASTQELGYEVNIRRLENLVARGEPPRWIGMIINVVKNTTSFSLTSTLFNKNDFKAAFIPMPDPEKVTVKGFAKKLKLHDYQQKAISWMSHVEKTAEEDIDYVRLVPWKGVPTDLLFDTEGNRVCSAKDLPEYTKQMSHKGGILADEMGLGKTVEVIGLLLSNPCKELPEVKDSFASKATLVVCPNHLTKQWVDEISKHTSPALKTHLITTMAELKAVTYGNLCDADVVVVSTSFLKNPNYFFHEAPDRSSGMGRGCNEARMDWVEKTFKRLHTKKNWREEASPILDLFHWHRLVLDEGHETLTDELLDDIVWKYSSTYTWYVTGTPFPNSKLLERVPILLGLATDWPHEQMEYYDMGVKQDYMINNLLWRNLKANITTQYDVPELATEDIKLKFTTVETAIYQYLTMTKEGTYYYRSRDEDTYRRYCDGMRRVAKTLTEERENYRSSCQGQIYSLDARTNNNIKRKEEYEKNTPEELATWNQYRLNSRLEFLQNFEETQKKLADERAMYVTLLEALKSSRSPAEEAKEKEQGTSNSTSNNDKTNQNAKDYLPSTPPLNTENDENNNNKEDENEDKKEEESKQEENEPRRSGRAKRGAKAQKEAPPPKKGKAAPAAGAKKGRGKKKAEQSEGDDASEAATEQNDPNKVRLYKSKLTAEEELPLIIERRGTKLANLVIYLRKLFTFQKKARTIIFSQYSELLSTIEELLGKCGIECAFVEGSVYKKNKALGSFKAGNTKTKVILLSLEKAASGTNLVEASHVIFMEPMQGTKQEIDAYEAQAIGRAHRQGQKNKVTIVRFYVENTIEEELYNARKGIRKAPQVRTKSGLLVRTNSLSTMLANQTPVNTTDNNTNNNNTTNITTANTAQAALLKRSGSIANLLAQGSAVV